MHKKEGVNNEYVKLLKELLRAWQKRFKEATSEEKKEGLRQNIVVTQEQLEQSSVKYIRSREALLSTCPFSSEYDHFKAALSAPVKETCLASVTMKPANWLDLPKPATTSYVKAEARGDYWLIPLTKGVLSKRLENFKFEFLGFKHYYISSQSMPESLLPMIELHRVGLRNIYFQACRITHEPSSTEIRVHSCAFHDRVVVIYKFPLLQSTKADLKVLDTALGFFQYEGYFIEEEMLDVPPGASLTILHRVEKRGRRPGSRTRRSSGEIQRRKVEREARIRKGIDQLYSRANTTWPESKKEVAGAVGISVKTLTAWLREGKLDLEDLITREVRGNGKRETNFHSP